jgi:cyclase
MLRPRIIPCLLLKDHGLVKTVKFKDPAYIGDPVNAIRIFNEKEVDELIVLDIYATKERRKPAFDVIAEIAGECFMPLTYGGGLDSLEDINEVFKLGVEKVSVNTRAIRDPEFVRQIASAFGSQSVIVSIDARKISAREYAVFVENGAVNTKISPLEAALRMEKMGAGEILLTSIDRDGTWTGFDLDLIAPITRALSIPVIVSGGAGRNEHIKQAIDVGGASGVGLGSMAVFQGKDLGVLIKFPSPSEIFSITS